MFPGETKMIHVEQARHKRIPWVFTYLLHQAKRNG
ncbi:hypothetical protein [Paenibacillus larvae]